MLNHFLKFHGKRSHADSIPENAGKCSDHFYLTGNAERNLVSECLRLDVDLPEFRHLSHQLRAGGDQGKPLAILSADSAVRNHERPTEADH